MNCSSIKDYTIRNGTAQYLKSYLRAIDIIENQDSNEFGGDYYLNQMCNCPECQLVEYYYPPRPQPDMNYDTQMSLFNDGEYNNYYHNLYNLD